MKSRHSAARHFINSGLFDRLDSFFEIEARISALPSNKERGDAFEVFAEAYLATQKINEAREVWPFEAIPQEQLKLLSLDTGRDMGVDGIYQTHDGELRAYQVKFRSNRPALTWDELSTFMGLTDQVSQRVLFTNSETLPGLMRDRSGFIAIRGSDLDRLTPDDFESMRLWLQSRTIKFVRKQPLPHQAEALTAIFSELNDNDRATVVMACGTGKSLVALWAAEQRGCSSILVLLPSLALVRQLLHEWLRETAWEQLAYLCVCSDPTVAKDTDELVVHQSDLDFPVTTDSATVGKFLGKPFDGVKVVFSTYQSARIVAEGMLAGADGVKLPFDLAIFDEAHKTASRSGTQFSFALTDENLPIRKRLFFTATPRHYDIRKKDKEGDNTLDYSMDRPEIYGRVAHTLSFAKAARDGIICDYKVVISVVTSGMLNEHALKHGEVIVAGDAVKARQVALQIALQKAVEKYGVSRIFTFHGSVAAAKSFTSGDGEGIRQHLTDFQTLHVSGAMSTSDREGKINAFRQAEKAVISNARCLTEGVDVPAVDMVAFMSPRKSKVDIVQATGRAMRKSPGKQQGYVMVPLFLDMTADETIEEALHRTDFSDVWDVLSAMKEQDDVLTDIIRQLREEKGRAGGYDESRLRERVEVLGPSVSLDVIRNSITAECIENLGSSWDEWFGLLGAFVEREGHSRVLPKYQSEDGYRLGQWVNSQRSNKDSLTVERKSRLETLTGWSWEPRKEKWKERFSELLTYKVQHGNVNIATDPSNELWVWMRKQRQSGKAGTLPEEKLLRLNEIGFDWDPRAAQWDEMFNELLSYKEQHGDVNVPDEWSTPLGTWVGKQRASKRSGKLSDDRLHRLADVGFAWDANESRWEARYGELRAYREKHGDVNIPHDRNSELWRWVSTQRIFKKRGKLPTDKIRRLDDIDFIWDFSDFQWELRFNDLLAYRAYHGNVNVSQSESTGLGAWANTQRSAKKSGGISDERIYRLNELGFIWDVIGLQWESKFNELLAYKVAHGSVNVPQAHAGLGTWVSNQRSARKSGRLSEERVLRLEKIGFEWESKKK